MNWLNPLFRYFVIIGDTEHTFYFQFENFSVQKKVSNGIVSVSQKKDLGMGSYSLVRLVSEVSDDEDNLSFRG